MRKLLLIIVFVFSMPFFAQQKQAKDTPPKMKTLYKAASLAMKNKSGQDAAKNSLLQQLPREDLKEKDKAKIYYVAALLDESNNSLQNKKAFLKKMVAADSMALFSTILTLYQDALLCDSIDAIPNSRGRVVLKFGNKTENLMKRYRSNLLTGGKYYLKKNDYANAFPYLDVYLRTAKDTLDVDYNMVSYWATICAYNLKNPLNTLKYSVHAFNYADDANKPILQEYRVISYQMLESNQAFERELRVGVRDYPSHDFFFVNLNDLIYSQRRYDEGISLADSMLALDSNKSIYWYGKSIMNLGKQDFDKCIEFSDSCLSKDPNYVDAYFNKGISYCNLALIAQENANKDKNGAVSLEDYKKIQDFYSKAKPCMEMVRKLQPENKERWAHALYRIYLYLNMGKEFDEIDKLLKN